MERKIISGHFGEASEITSIKSTSVRYLHRGINYFKENDFNNALLCFLQSLDYDNSNHETFSAIGSVFLHQGKFHQAVKMFKDAINLDDKISIYHYNLGIAYTQLDLIQEAKNAYKECLKIDPKNKKALKFLGNCYKDLKCFNEALRTYRKLEKLDPKNPEPVIAQSQVHIRLGRFNIGWKLYEAGLKNNIRKPFEGYYTETKPIWDGIPFDGGLLVYGEQGIGDQIIFGTVLPELIKKQKNISLKVDERLIPMFKETFPEITIFPEQLTVPKNSYDKFISLGSLCKFYRNHTNDFLKSSFHKYKVNPSNNMKIKSMMSKISGFKVGISWHSFSTISGRQRCLSTENLSRIVSIENINFINIQYGSVLKQVNEIELSSGKDILKIPFVDLTKDLLSLASIINNCDLVITVDNATAHLASSLGKTVWVLLPFSADFRWMENINPTLWYDNATIIRQKEIGNWSSVVDTICDAFKNSNLCEIDAK